MKKIILLVVLLTLVAFVFGVIAATPQKGAETTAPAKLEKFSGEIKSSDATSKTIIVAKGKEEKTFVVDEQAKITKGTESLTFADLKLGMGVEIEYKQEKGKMIAMVIKVSAPKAETKPEQKGSKK